MTVGNPLARAPMMVWQNCVCWAALSAPLVVIARLTLTVPAPDGPGAGATPVLELEVRAPVGPLLGDLKATAVGASAGALAGGGSTFPAGVVAVAFASGVTIAVGATAGGLIEPGEFIALVGGMDCVEMVGAKVGGAILVLGGGGIGDCDSGGGCDWLGAGALANVWVEADGKCTVRKIISNVADARYSDGTSVDVFILSRPSRR